MIVSTGMIPNAKMILGSVLPSGWIMDPKLEKFWYPLSTFFGIFVRETGYAHIQATKPDTLGKSSFRYKYFSNPLDKYSTTTRHILQSGE